MWYVLLIIIFIFGGMIGYRYYDKPDPAYENFTPIAVELDPDQQEQPGLSKITQDISRGNLYIQPVAEYKISGRILAKKKYGSTWTAKLAPYDLAIGWGKLAEPEIIEKIKFSQWGRFYFFKHNYGLPFQDDYIIEHSSNNHIIPANQNLKKLLFHLKENELIEMEGYLVNVSGRIKNDSVSWRTSLKRDDTGNGSCEIFYVQKIKYDNKVYE
jgi:hypothetical protein